VIWHAGKIVYNSTWQERRRAMDTMYSTVNVPHNPSGISTGAKGAQVLDIFKKCPKNIAVTWS
jgi:hypothetical protein